MTLPTRFHNTLYTCEEHGRSVIVYQSECPACELDRRVVELEDENSKLALALEELKNEESA